MLRGWGAGPVVFERRGHVRLLFHRKPRKDENLSEEAAKVIAALPDLSFMHAKVLMFPATLMAPCSQATPD